MTETVDQRRPGRHVPWPASSRTPGGRRAAPAGLTARHGLARSAAPVLTACTWPASRGPAAGGHQLRRGWDKARLAAPSSEEYRSSPRHAGVCSLPVLLRSRRARARLTPGNRRAAARRGRVRQRCSRLPLPRPPSHRPESEDLRVQPVARPRAECSRSNQGPALLPLARSRGLLERDAWNVHVRAPSPSTGIF